MVHRSARAEKRRAQMASPAIERGRDMVASPCYRGDVLEGLTAMAACTGPRNRCVAHRVRCKSREA